MCALTCISIGVDETPQEVPACGCCSLCACNVQTIGVVCVGVFVIDHKRPFLSKFSDM